MNSCEPPDLDSLDRPAWWPDDLTFSEDILRKQKEHRRILSLRLKNAIRRCYKHHKCEFLVEFCRKLVEYTGGVENLEVVDNKDGTRSLHKKKDKKLLVTFRSENQDYDKHQNVRKPKLNTFSAKSPLKTLDSKRLLWNKSDNTSDPAMSTYADIYLCDTCDKDFDSLPTLIAHEKDCGRAEVIIEPKPLHATKSDPLLTYLRLKARGSKVTSSRKLRDSERPRALSYEKFMEIEVSSPLGIYITTSSRLHLDQQNPSVRGYMSAQDYIQQQETKCPGTISALKTSNAYTENRNKYPNVYKTNRKRSAEYVHLYTFSSSYLRKRRLMDINNGLNQKALRLWRKCEQRKLFLSLNVLPRKMVEEKMQIYHEATQVEASNKKKRGRKKKNLVEVDFFPFEDAIQSQIEQKEAAPGEEPKYTSAQPLTPVFIPIDDITLSDSDIEVDFQSKCTPSTECRAGPGNLQNSSKVRTIQVGVYQPIDEIHQTEYKPTLVPLRSAPSNTIEYVDLISSDED
ncbi:uncharacterized protein LOC111707472 [Eurytemora carolleeae]|uniref:uncharacterized protein LOC111707472 n=1 Tax=Eurytemora carolleeae TaxID=1294199 RepID=UPI000C778E00|nr:uncharacterized protein LOC111707472 [Eurytemora carolleeae]|eukprot:XP_023336350.1 uncharacterized protein LOC111707472 [Eurytemora affinis]